MEVALPEFRIESSEFKMRTRFFFTLFLLFILYIICQPVFAESSYVLPYPSSMPGSIFYKLDLVKETLMKYWYFGDFGQFNYDFKESDKYLVEAKVLFDYKQYLLAVKALRKSDGYFKKIKPNLDSALHDGKNVKDKEEILKEAAEKHIEELNKIKNSTPINFYWQSEKSEGTKLNLSGEILNSIKIRQEIVN